MQTAMVSRPSPGEATTALDVPPPRRTSPLPGIVVLVALGLALVGGTTWWLLRPEPGPSVADPCQGKFRSPLNPYCVQVPQGWTGRTVRTTTGALDTFRPSEESPDVGVVVQAGSVVPGVTTGIYAQDIRSTQEAVGLSLTPVRATRLDGEIAVVWDFTARGQTGELIQQRHVVVVRGELGWRITLTGQPEKVDEAAAPFAELLSTWRFDYPEPPPLGGGAS
jgi:hypothetical protein